MTDIVERLRAVGGFFDQAAFENGVSCSEIAGIIESLRQQLAEANDQVNQLNNMMRDKGFGQGEIDTMGWYEQQLAECQAREQLRIDALYALAKLGNGDHYGNSEGNLIAYKALAMPSDSTALDELKRQWQRETLLEAADCFMNDPDYLVHDVFSITTMLRRMAKELE